MGQCADQIQRDTLTPSLVNGHPPGSDGPMATALKRYDGGRVLVFVVGAFTEMSEDGICHSYLNDINYYVQSRPVDGQKRETDWRPGSGRVHLPSVRIGVDDPELELT